MYRLLLVAVIPLLMGMVTLQGSGTQKSDFPPERVDTSLLIQDDRFVPIPWSTQRSFPWQLIDGTWLAQNGDFESYFVFKTRTTTVDKRVEVRQVDVVTCKTVAVGLGTLAVNNSKTLSAHMEYLGFRQSYNLMVRSYQYGGPVKDISINPVDGQVVLLSIMPEDRPNYVHMALTKVSKEARVGICRTRK